MLWYIEIRMSRTQWNQRPQHQHHHNDHHDLQHLQPATALPHGFETGPCRPGCGARRVFCVSILSATKSLRNMKPCLLGDWEPNRRALELNILNCWNLLDVKWTSSYILCSSMWFYAFLCYFRFYLKLKLTEYKQSVDQVTLQRRNMAPVSKRCSTRSRHDGRASSWPAIRAA